VAPLVNSKHVSGRTGRWPRAARWLVGAALLVAACQSGESGARLMSRAEDAAPAPASVAPAQVIVPVESGAGTVPVVSAPGPTPPEVLDEYVEPLWGSFVERHFHSAALDREMPYYIYLPPDYDSGSRVYPVLYMLHGAAGDNAEWATVRLINWAERLILGQELPPTIVVLPQGDFGYWVNHAEDGPRWGDYVVADLVGHIDATYRTDQRPGARAIGGNSQGGHGALQLTFNHPEVFGIAGAHSPSLRLDDGALPFLGTGDEFAWRDPITLAETLPVDALRRATLWLDVGTEDQWQPRVETLHATLEAREVPHEFHEWPGSHDGDYWQPHVPDYLRYYGQALRGRTTG
jgi:enterochelin esterase-like enzyme